MFYNGTTLIKTESTAPYSFTWSNVAAGTYKLTAKATDNSGKTTTSSIVTFSVGSAATSTMGISGASESSLSTTEIPSATFDFRLFPNPAVDKIQVMLTSFQDTKKANLIIQNMAGSVIKNIPLKLSDNRIEVDISGLSTGMYMMSIITDNSVVNKKFIKGN